MLIKILFDILSLNRMLTWIWQWKMICVNERRKAGEYANYATKNSDTYNEYFPCNCSEF